MSLNEDSTVDWGKMAAEWVSQRKTQQGEGGPAQQAMPGGMSPGSFPPMRPQFPFMPPGMMMFPGGYPGGFPSGGGGFPPGVPGFPSGGGFPPIPPGMMMMPPGCPPMFYPHHQPLVDYNNGGGGGYRPPPFVPPAPFVSPEAEMKGRGSSQLPRWLVEAVKDKERGVEPPGRPFEVFVDPSPTTVGLL